MPITFVDLFSGIGGFHAIGKAFGWEATYACDIDARAAKVYERNWGMQSHGDITEIANKDFVKIGRHDVLFAGFPCQPFSKSGRQHGMDEARGTLFWNIARVIQVRKPKLVMLENVPNIAGPRHRHEWEVIIQTLRDLGYAVSDLPFLMSPHRIPKKFGGRPQTRERVYINATLLPARLRTPRNLAPQPLSLDKLEADWDPNDWNLATDLPIESALTKKEKESLVLTAEETLWINVWDDLLGRLLQVNKDFRFPGFPLWFDVWDGSLKVSIEMPEWKKGFIKKNREFYLAHKRIIDEWMRGNSFLKSFPASRRKLEWQAQGNKSIWHGIIQFRPSGIRVKRANYAPAAVAITQTSIYGPQKRKLSVREVARLQGVPDWFDFSEQSLSSSYRQLGNGISVGCAYQSMKLQVMRDAKFLSQTAPLIVDSILNSPKSPDRVLNKK